MLPPEAFELSLEKQLRLQVIKKEISDCSDVEALRENLITCAESLMKYQQVCAVLAEQNLKGMLGDILSAMGIEFVENPDG